MWEEPSSKSYINQINKSSDDEINAKYEVGEQRILTEMNREKLPLFVEALKKPGYLDIQPCFQRRPRWDSLKQSKLIESFLMNIPVPPVILYQKSYGSYEVIDGQQRIVAIQDFYENKLVLHGLKIWAELNGRTYEQLPRKIKVLIDRRSITYIVLITEPIADTEEALILKQLAFERINTGGIELSPQEVRNCLYYGKFNQLLLDLSRNSIFANAWGIPINNSNKLLQNTLYTKMEDTELILRFFALRNIDNYWNGMQEFLNFYMIKALNFYDEDIEILKNIFCLTIETADKIYEDKLFKPFDPKTQNWKKKPIKLITMLSWLGLVIIYPALIH